ncbi:MAG: hypothetical protein IPJ82_13750 [Lewinellaceae bacterium]|nr:hypothetical protein [Lewinellaceae bacterium]
MGIFSQKRPSADVFYVSLHVKNLNRHLLRVPSRKKPQPTPFLRVPSRKKPQPTPFLRVPSRKKPQPTPFLRVPSREKRQPTPFLRVPTGEKGNRRCFSPGFLSKMNSGCDQLFIQAWINYFQRLKQPVTGCIKIKPSRKKPERRPFFLPGSGEKGGRIHKIGVPAALGGVCHNPCLFRPFTGKAAFLAEK